jgi:ADP-heptose:LPS heptosyltransferase
MRILVHRICGVGDVVQITPLLQQIRLDCPAAEILFMTSQNAADLLVGAPYLDRVISMSLESVTPRRANLFLWQMWHQIRTQAPLDMLVTLDARWLNTLGAVAVPARKKIGLSTHKKWRPHPFDEVLYFPANPQEETRHASQVFLDLWTKGTGHKDRGLSAALPHLGQDDPQARLGIEQLSKRYLCIAPGAGNWLNPANYKRWPAPHWRQLMDHAAKAGWQVVVLGTAGDFPSDRLPAGALDLTGRTTLAETASLIRHSGGFIGHDSGLFHLALGLHVPAVAFFGPTRADLTGPFRKPNSRVLRATSVTCAPCCHADCILPDAAAQAWHGAPPCMAQIRPDEAWTEIEEFLAARVP